MSVYHQCRPTQQTYRRMQLIDLFLTAAYRNHRENATKITKKIFSSSFPDCLKCQWHNITNTLSVDVMIASQCVVKVTHDTTSNAQITLKSYDAPRHMSSYRTLNLYSSLYWESVEAKQVITLPELINAECHVISTSKVAARNNDTEICLRRSRQWWCSTL